MTVQDSDRTKDEHFGYLTVENCVLTGNDVAQYFGREIPDFRKLGLDPEKIYYVYRPEDEIEDADFTNKPLLSDHADFSADDYKHKLISGTVGETYMQGEQLKGTVVFWHQKAIDELEKGKKYLSCGYLYTPVLERGFHKNTRYDVKMTKIVANHVAMVDNPRYKAAIVSDEDTITPFEKEFSMFFSKKTGQPKVTYTFEKAVEDIKKILTMDGEESLKEKAMGEVKKKVEKEMGKDKSCKDEEKEEKKKEDMAEDEGSEEMDDGEWGEGAEDEELEDKEQKAEEKKEAGEAKAKDKKGAKDKMAKDEAIRRLVADSVSKEMEKFHKKTMAFDAAIKEYERTCGRVNKLAFDSADKVLDTILKNHKKNFSDKSFEQKQAMVEMLPNGNKAGSYSPSLVMDSSSSNAKSHTPTNIIDFLKRG